MSTTRGANILADWNQGGITPVDLAGRYECPVSTILSALHRARRKGIDVRPSDTSASRQRAVETRRANAAALQYQAATSIDDLTTDAYRVVSRQVIVGDQSRWDDTIPVREMGQLRDEMSAGRIFAPQTVIDGQRVIVARIVPAKSGRRLSPGSKSPASPQTGN